MEMITIQLPSAKTDTATMPKQGSGMAKTASPFGGLLQQTLSTAEQSANTAAATADSAQQQMLNPLLAALAAIAAPPLPVTVAAEAGLTVDTIDAVAVPDVNSTLVTLPGQQALPSAGLAAAHSGDATLPQTLTAAAEEQPVAAALPAQPAPQPLVVQPALPAVPERVAASAIPEAAEPAKDSVQSGQAQQLPIAVTDAGRNAVQKPDASLPLTDTAAALSAQLKPAVTVAAQQSVLPSVQTPVLPQQAEQHALQQDAVNEPAAELLVPQTLAPEQDAEASLMQNRDNTAGFINGAASAVKSAATTDAAPAFEPVSTAPDQQGVVRQIVDQARLYLRPGNQSEMVVQLRPEHLGELTVKISVASGVVNAAFHSDNPEVRQVIEAALPQLRQELSQQGIKLDNVGVFSGTTQFFDRGQQQATQQQIPLRKNRRQLIETMEAVEAAAVDADGVDYRI
ncbi:MAG: flagellar hook-length control protein FliK [Sporomusaceae bacterium]|nr:flagellar hook-length control protein FliK [Sporomusaceae bacterium]